MHPITNLQQLNLNGTYTYADYLLWKLQERVELLKGKIFKMSPAPALAHQRVSMHLSGELYSYFKNKKCQVFAAPFDVRIPAQNEQGDAIHTVVQPDLCIICDPEKIDERGCLGAPDLIIEILSPGNSRKEMKNKYEIYEASGVLEYWVVVPSEKVIHIYVLKDGKYIGLAPVVEGEYIHSEKFPELKVNTADIFSEP
ncbi:MAG: Uma2 family endonuclease [Capnocytophaga sp.]|nr:Uma2 family endonuclease [Capnocytophaga sp.]